MAKQRFGINDGYRGTVGTVIGYVWRGKWCLRARPRQVYNPRTPRQQANRALFRQMVALAGSMKRALREGMHSVSMQLHMTECNLFVKRNRECFSLESSGSMAVDWERLVVSEGPLAAPLFEIPSISSPLPGSNGDPLFSSPKLGEVDAQRADGGVCITVLFEPCAEGASASGDDAVYLYAYCPGAGEGRLSVPASRRKGQVRLSLPMEWQGLTVYLYGFAVDYKCVASDTVYIGELESDLWHNNCGEEYVINENNIPSWQTSKNRKTSKSTSTPTWPKAPTRTSPSSAILPPRSLSTSPRCFLASTAPRCASASL